MVGYNLYKGWWDKEKNWHLKKSGKKNVAGQLITLFCCSVCSKKPVCREKKQNYRKWFGIRNWFFADCSLELALMPKYSFRNSISDFHRSFAQIKPSRSQLKLPEAMHCVSWFGFAWNTLRAESDHSHLEWQSSFCWLTLFCQVETLGLGEDLASLHVEILVCLFFIITLARGVCTT